MADKDKFEDLAEKGLVALDTSNFTLARKYLEEALFYEAEDSKKVRVLNGITKACYFVGDFHGALYAADKARLVCQMAGDQVGLSSAYNNLGVVNHTLGHYREALGYYEEALTTAREHGSDRETSQFLNNLGAMRELLGEYDTAEETFAESISAKRRMGKDAEAGSSLGNLGIVELRRGRLGRALALFTESIPLNLELNAIHHIAECIIHIGIIYRHLDLPEKSRETLETAVRLAEKASLSHIKILSHVELAGSCINLGDIDEAGKLLYAARQLLGSADELTITWVGALECVMTALRGKRQAAIIGADGILSERRGSQSVNVRMKASLKAARTYLLCAASYVERKNGPEAQVKMLVEKAREIYSRKLKLSKEIGRGEDLPEIYGSLAECATMSGDKRQAKKFTAQAKEAQGNFLAEEEKDIDTLVEEASAAIEAAVVALLS